MGSSYAKLAGTPGVCTDVDPNQNQGFGDNAWLAQLLGMSNDAAVAGASGAGGRHGAVNTIHQLGYNLGFNTPQQDHSGSLFRNVPTAHQQTALDSSFGAKSGGRYNGPGVATSYHSGSFAESVGESTVYDGMAKRTMVESDYTAPFDAKTGKGGLADLTKTAKDNSLTKALTAKGGKGGPSWLWGLTGEHPYTLPQQMAKGALDAGASSIKAPSAVGGDQLNIFPQNTPSGSVIPKEVTLFDDAGVKLSSSPANSPGSPDTKVGPFVEQPGVGKGPLKSPTSLTKNGGASAGGLPTTTTRGSSAMMGGLGGGVTSLISAGMADGDLTLAEGASATALGTGTGALSSAATDTLVNKGMGATKAGGLVSAVLSGGFSSIHNYGAWKDGELDGEQAIANVAVDTGVGLASGLSGAAAGAAIGSIFPGLGTAVGAGVGFLAGSAASLLTSYALEESGLANAAKSGLGSGLGWLSNKLGFGDD